MPLETSLTLMLIHEIGQITSKLFDRFRVLAWEFVLFSLPEASLLATNSAIDDMTNHLIGKSVRVIS